MTTNARQTPVLDSMTASELDELLTSDSPADPHTETVSLDSLWEEETIRAFNAMCDEAGERERDVSRHAAR